MNLLKRIFGPRQIDVWKQLSDELGGTFVKGGFFKTNRVEARVGKWTVTLDTYTVSTGKSTIVFTRMRAPFTNEDGFRFVIHRKSMFSGVGKLFGMQDIEVGGPKFESLEPLFGAPSYVDPEIIESGDPEFDRDFIIKSNDVARARLLFKQLKIRELVSLQPSIELKINAKGSNKRQVRNDGDAELYFQVTGVIKDLERLKQLFELYSEVLKSLEASHK
jgi:hypothetical protein